MPRDIDQAALPVDPRLADVGDLAGPHPEFPAEYEDQHRLGIPGRPEAAGGVDQLFEFVFVEGVLVRVSDHGRRRRETNGRSARGGEDTDRAGAEPSPAASADLPPP